MNPIIHTKPTCGRGKTCGQCAFSRDIEPGALGGSSPLTYIGQTNGNFWIPCHCHTDYSDPNWKLNTNKPQCAGAAIFRANIGRDKNPSLHRLPADTVQVFATAAEFLAHHTRTTVEQAQTFLNIYTPDMLTQFELQRAGTNFHLIPKT